MHARSPALITLLLIGLAVSGCSSSKANTAPANTQANPGPNPTTGDPGPNNTSNGPETLQGTLISHSGCIELAGNAANEPLAHFQLQFTDEAVTHKGTTIVLTGPDGARQVGPHDVAFIAGKPGTGTGPCGAVFKVEKVVAVTPG